ncbi:MAG TPA: AtpZ/AtpI family protein [Phycisphaerae bacterium]|nr:AtpZ/AtpI family protein [Phycisphaerae bacterium]
MARTDDAAERGRADRAQFADTVGAKEKRKIKGRRQRERGPLFYVGMFGIVGWSVAVPTVLGILAGWMIDRRWPGGVSWTLTLMLLGVVLGCLNAWLWVRRASGRDD